MACPANGDKQTSCLQRFQLIVCVVTHKPYLLHQAGQDACLRSNIGYTIAEGQTTWATVIVRGNAQTPPAADLKDMMPVCNAMLATQPQKEKQHTSSSAGNVYAAHRQNMLRIGADNKRC
jgi:hypothetical protein